MSLPGHESSPEDPKLKAYGADGGADAEVRKQKLVDSGYQNGVKDKAQDQPVIAKKELPGLTKDLCNAFCDLIRASRNQAAIEDALKEQSSTIGFSAELRTQLETHLDRGEKLPDQIKEKVLTELKAGHIKSSLESPLEKFAKGEASPSEQILLKEALSSGLYKEQLIESIVRNDAKVNRFGSASMAIWQSTVKDIESLSTDLASNLAKGKAKYIEADAPFTADQYQKWVEEKEKPRVKLQIDFNHTPDIASIVKVRDTLLWNRMSQVQTNSVQRRLTSGEAYALLKKHDRIDWLSKPNEQPDAKERRLTEIAGVLGPAKVAEDTLEALKWITERREKNEDLPWTDSGYWNTQKPLFSHNSWMLEAIKTFPGDSESGTANVPKNLSDTIINSDTKKEVADWVDKYGKKTAEFMAKLLVNVNRSGGILLYGIRDKVNQGDTSLNQADPAKSPENNDYNRIGYDFDVQKIVDKDGNISYKVTQYTDYIQSNMYNLWDLHASPNGGRVDKERQAVSHVYSGDDLVPFSYGGQVYFVEPERLAHLHSRERNTYTAGKTAEVGLDVAFTLLPMARAAKATRIASSTLPKEGVKGLIKEAATKELLSSGAMSCLALAGGLNNAAVRQTPYGPSALMTRNTAFLLMISRDLSKKFAHETLESIGISGAETAETGEVVLGDSKIVLTEPLSESAANTAAAKHLPEVSIEQLKKIHAREKLIDTIANRADAAIHVIMLAQLSKETGSTILRKLQPIEKNTADQRLSSGKKLYDDLANALLVDTSRTILTRHVPQDIQDRVNAIFRLAKKDYPEKSVDNQKQLAELDKSLQSANINERVAAAQCLLSSKTELNVDESKAKTIVDQLRSELKRAAANPKDKNILSPDAELLVAQSLLANGGITQQQYALETIRIAKLASATPEAKMEAISSLGGATWAAEITDEANASDPNYWSVNHGCAQADLYQQLQSISSGKSGEKNSDVRAFAAATLYALNHDSEQNRIDLFKKAKAEWTQNFDPENSGKFAAKYTADMQKEISLHIPNRTLGRERESLRQRQYLASVALADMGGAERKAGLEAIAKTVDTSAPIATVRALKYLSPHLKELDKKTQNYTIDKAILLLAGTPNATNAETLGYAKNRVLEVLPTLLNHSSNISQFNRSVSTVSRLLDHSPYNRLYAYNADTRRLAAKTLADLHASQAENTVAKSLMYQNNKSPIESSPYVRLEVLKALRSWHSPALREIAKSMVENEYDPRLKQEALDILDTENKALAAPVELVQQDKNVDIEYAKAEKFLNDNFPHIFKDAFDKEIKRLTPEYSRWVFKNEYDHHNYPEEAYAQARIDWQYKYMKNFPILERWAQGDFNQADMLTEDSKEMPVLEGSTKHTQMNAINSLALIVENDGLLSADKHLPLRRELPELNRREIIDSCAQSLGRVAINATDPEIRELALRRITNIIQNKDVHPRAKYELLPAFRNAWQDTATASLSKAEAAQMAIDALINQRTGKWHIEDNPNLQTETQKHDKDGAWSIEFQSALMKDLTYQFQAREQVLPVIEKIAKEAKPDRLRAQAQECIFALKDGINIAYRRSSTNPDITTPLNKRADIMETALKTANENLGKTVSDLFQYSSGRNLSNAGDPRLPVLVQGLNHENSTVQLASALCLVNNHANGAPVQLAMRRLMYLAEKDGNSSIKYEAKQKLAAIEKVAQKAQIEFNWRSSNPRGATAKEKELYKSRSATKAKEYTDYLQDITNLQEQAKNSNTGVLFFYESAALKANNADSPSLAPDASVSELERKLDSKENATDDAVIERLFETGLDTKFSPDGKDPASQKYVSLLQNKNERIALASAAVLISRSQNVQYFRAAIDKLITSESSSESGAIKKEAGILLDSSLKHLKSQATYNSRMERFIADIELERARALGIPVQN